MSFPADSAASRELGKPIASPVIDSTDPPPRFMGMAIAIGKRATRGAETYSVFSLDSLRSA